MRLKLTSEWDIGERIGGGGFGEIYAATSPDHRNLSAVAKLVRKAPGGQRELLFVSLDGVRNVIPAIDSGDTEDHWVIVMPRAEKSLRHYIDELAAPIDVPSGVLILLDIVSALADLDGKVVHRDLKPENILLLNGKWCLADFGISRYAEATTAPDTQKYALSPPYSAPERWRGERSSIATDIYSLGVIMFELFSNALPFTGPYLHDFRAQHLHADPPTLSRGPVALKALTGECLYKAPGARPGPANILARLESIERMPASPGRARLQDANLAEVARRGESVRRDSEVRSEADRRKALIDDATSSIKSISEELKTSILESAPSAVFSDNAKNGWSIRINQASLEFTRAIVPTANSWGARFPPAIDIIAYASLNLRIPTDRYQYEGRSHSLWFCDAKEAGRYRWFEAAFMLSPFIAKRARQNPFALAPGEEAAAALWRGLAEFQVAWPFTPMAIGELDEFVDRWAGWLADAAQGRLQLPSSMPERPSDGSWRRD
jgi:serine/threonine-protein kinase